MKLSIVLACASLAASAAAAAEPATVVGTWEREPIAGVAGFLTLTFTADGRLMAERNQFLARYQVDKRRVSARAAFGETYNFELIEDGRLCVSPGPGIMPLAGDRDARLAAGLCFRKLAQPA
jgi:hypothetical protein